MTKYYMTLTWAEGQTEERVCDIVCSFYIVKLGFIGYTLFFLFFLL